MSINTPKNIQNLSTLDKVMKTAIYDNADAGYNPWYKSYYPILEVGHIVQCQFIGIGSEFNDVHFGVVISASRNKETLQIVPLTSKAIERDRGQFSIGKVTNFITSRDNQVKESFVYVNKITEVTRRKIKLWFQKDSTGKPVKNSSNKNVAVKVDDVQMNRIREGVELVLLHKENYLLNIIKGVHVSYLPVKSTNDDIFKLGYRLVPKDSKIVSNDEILINCSVGGKEVEITFKKFDRSIFDDRSNFSDETIKYHKNHIERRNEILKGLFSQNLSMVNKAKVFLPD